MNRTARQYLKSSTVKANSYLEQLRSDPRVASVDDERRGETGPNTDGIWVYLKPGFDSNDDPHAVMTAVHEWNMRDLRRAMARVTKVDPAKVARLVAQTPDDCDLRALALELDAKERP